MPDQDAKEKKEEEYSFLLLAGGKSSRMGRDKGELMFRGQTFLDCQLKKAKELGIQEKYLSGHGWKGTGVHVIPDTYQNRGPLGGMYACMKNMKTPYCLVVPVDVPQLPGSILKALLDVHKKGSIDRSLPLLLAHEGRTEPLIGIYPTAMAAKIGQMIREGAAPVFQVLDLWGYQVYSIRTEWWETENINTPQEYQKLLECGKRGNKE